MESTEGCGMSLERESETYAILGTATEAHSILRPGYLFGEEAFDTRRFVL